MTDQDEPTYDTHPRDQVEHYKIELSRLRAENERLTSETEYLRQALAASMSKIPQIESSSSAPQSPSPLPRITVPQTIDKKSMDTIKKVVPLASILTPPFILIVFIVFALVCAITLYGVYLSLSPTP